MSSLGAEDNRWDMLRNAFERAVNFDPSAGPLPGSLRADIAAEDQRVKELRKEREQDQYRQRAKDDRDRKRRQDENKDIGDDVSDLQAKIDQRANELRSRIEIARAETIEQILHHERELARLNGELDGLRANAIILADGRRAYVTDHGGYVAEDGGTLTDEDLEGAQLPQGAPTRYEDLQDKQAERSATREDLQSDRDRLGKLDEIEDGLDSNDALTMDDLDDLGSDLDAALEDTEPTSNAPTPHTAPTTDVTVEPVYSAPSA